MTAFRPLPNPLDRAIRLGVLISGGGTTLINFLEQIASRRLRADVPLVIASRPDCSGVDRARQAGIPCLILERRTFDSVDSYSAAVFEALRGASVDLVTLAGFLCLLRIPADFHSRVMNIHPSLIPAFSGRGYYGHHVHEAVLERGCRLSGCTVHFADNDYDHGPIILQQAVPVFADDTAELLAARVFQAECEAYPQAIRWFAAGRLEVVGRQVRLLPEPTSHPLNT